MVHLNHKSLTNYTTWFYLLFISKSSFFSIAKKLLSSWRGRTEYLQNLLTGFHFSIGALDFFNDPGYEVFFEGDESWRGGFWRVSGPVNYFAAYSND